MKVVYDPDQNILQLSLNGGTIAETAQISPNLILDYDEDGQLIGLELRNATTNVDNPYSITYEIGHANLDKPQPYRPKA